MHLSAASSNLDSRDTTPPCVQHSKYQLWPLTCCFQEEHPERTNQLRIQTGIDITQPDETLTEPVQQRAHA